MSARCEQEMCPFWAGDAWCPCDVLDIPSEEREAAKEALR